VSVSRKSAKANEREARRRSKRRHQEHQRACARAREALLASGWRVRPGVSGMVIERESFNRDGSESPHRLYGRDELQLLRKALIHNQETKRVGPG